MNRNRKERKHRMALTLLLSGVVFFVTLATLLLLGAVLYIAQRLELLAYWEKNASLSSFFLLVAAFSLLGGTLLAVFAGKIALKPVNKIINAMNRLASGDFQTRLSFEGPFGQYPTARELTDSFNAMAAELEGTELLRSDFINNFSHEFKTPIVSIAGFAGLLKQGNLSEEEQREYISIIENQSRRLADMATNVLNMTKVENKTILTDVIRFNLSEQLRCCVLLLEHKWEKKHQEINVDLAEYMICANRELLEQVWVNLIDNAVKFAPEYGTITISVALQEERLLVSVSNTGSSIPPEQQKEIFRKFYQADRSHSTEGNGIGLAIVKRVAELHGGTVRVDSNALETTFTVELPANLPVSNP